MTKENSCSQIRIITRIAAAGCLLSMILCYKLWLGERNFPTIPVLGHFSLQHPIDYVLPALTILLLAFIIILRNPQKLIIGFVITSALLAVLDLNRWQPWFFQYFMIFLVLAFFNFRCDDTRKQQIIVSAFKLMTASVYFWSGLQKLNPHFLSDTFPWLMEPLTNHMADGSIENFKSLGYAFPLVETLTGICLLIPALQKPAVILSTVMHVFILFVLSPFGHNYNPVVWPWNIAMIAFVFVLFYNEYTSGISGFRHIFSYAPTALAVILFTFMPLFNFFNSWDSYLSHNLYSGNTSNGVIYLSDSVNQQLPSYISKYTVKTAESNLINIKYWCMKELGVPAYPEKRNFQAVANTLHKYSKDPAAIYLEFTPKIKMSGN
jgi:uncharacterized membrane protein YphA (DoxX/SURF4 family)